LNTSLPVGGNVTEVQFNSNNQVAGDSGLTYNSATDSLTVSGNLTAGAVKTNSLLYANGSAWTLGSGTYGNSNVAAYIAAFPPAGTYSNSNVSSYLAANPQSGTYSNSNVATYISTYTGNVSASNVIVASALVGTGASPAPSLNGFNIINTVSANLGAVANVKISGGTSGQYLQTDGTGNLSWATVSGGGSFDSSAVLELTNTASSTSYTTGALKVAGGIGVVGNLNVGGTMHKFNGNVHVTGTASRTLFVGAAADSTPFTAPTLVMKNAFNTYVQAGLINSSANGSADWVAYADNGDDTAGWADMGMTSSNFNDENYTITGSNDGYFFVKAAPASGMGGNLVLATDTNGTHNDIVFAMGGFQTENEFARMSLTDQTFNVGGEVIIKNHNGHGGTGFAGMMTLENDEAIDGKKFVRIDSAGTLEIINHAYSQTLLSLTNLGDFSVLGNIQYTASNPSDWAGSAPTSIGMAIDKLAHAVALLKGSGV
jgi:hypothetical protein